jgi:hypothetical protein
MISMDKQYKTRDGREVRIYAVDGGGEYPVQGAIHRPHDGRWITYLWTPDGRSVHDTDCCDLIEVRPTVTRIVWLVHFGPASLHCAAAGHATREAAASYAKQCVNYDELLAVTGPHTITFTPGEGL